MFSARTDARAFYKGMEDMIRRGFPQVVAGTLTQAPLPRGTPLQWEQSLCLPRWK